MARRRKSGTRQPDAPASSDNGAQANEEAAEAPAPAEADTDSAETAEAQEGANAGDSDANEEDDMLRVVELEAGLAMMRERIEAMKFELSEERKLREAAEAEVIRLSGLPAPPKEAPFSISQEFWDKIRSERPNVRHATAKFKNVSGRNFDGPIGNITPVHWYPMGVQTLHESLIAEALEKGLEWVGWAQP